MDLSRDQQRLLCLVHMYTHAKGRKQRWIKELPLHVTIFHAILKGAFEGYDYAPSLITSHGVRIFANMSQEALHDIIVLRERNLVEKLKLSTRDYEDVGAYRITREGAEVVANLPGGMCADIRRAVGCPSCGNPSVFRIRKSLEEGGVRITAVRWCDSCGRPCEEAGDGCTGKIDFFTIQPVEYRTLPYLPEATR